MFSETIPIEGTLTAFIFNATNIFGIVFVVRTNSAQPSCVHVHGQNIEPGFRVNCQFREWKAARFLIFRSMIFFAGHPRENAS